MATEGTQQPGIDLGRYWSVLVARWPLVAIGAVIGLLGGASYLLAVPLQFVSSTTLVVYPITSDPYAANRNNSNILDMETEASIASSFKVASIAADSLKNERTSEDLWLDTQATSSDGSSTMTITVSDSTEAGSRASADAVATAYISARSSEAQGKIDSVIERQEANIAELRKSLADANRRYAAASPRSAEAATASADQQTINLQISALLTRISTLQSVDTSGGTVLDPASVTPVHKVPSAPKILAASLAGGTGLGVICAFVIHSRRRRIRTAKDIWRELDVSSLGAWGDQPSVDSNVAATAERILRAAEGAGAESVALVLDRALEWPSDLPEPLSRAINHSAKLTASGRVDVGRNDSSAIRMVSTSLACTEADRLRTLRTSDASVLVAVAGATRTDDLAHLIEECRQMNSQVLGVVVVPKSVVSETAWP